MLSYKPTLVVLYAVSVTFFFGRSLHALASPLPSPTSLFDHLNRRDSTALKVFLSRRQGPESESVPVDQKQNIPAPDASSYHDRISSLSGYYVNAKDHAANIKSCSAEAKTAKGSGSEFSDKCTSQVKDFQSNISGFQNTLAVLGNSQKGLANYDRSDELETLLKNLVNLNKEVLKDIDILVYSLPILGPVLGPIVYEVKCILIDILDVLENLTDAVLNAIRPLLGPFIDKYSLTQSCQTGLQLTGLCT
ncbi:hypothetical protein HETIRDRAFT_166754 [Heterobasidion irregulare TC 32-1]|uniref:Uncharacterized protein n=1 Tax=Heterobasidion irregulare (strain TC 32-1) TaxID=747525 RepID=W4KN24_HETIT|nr:uncharacterized protein HETIRDRAFT_166754 [Heterobasidion irregulare TC 32-1]ETW87217.1 hypothetical protein HETIRDRAFT_166754 [Heterobasidion irregulare TC 32-1]